MFEILAQAAPLVSLDWKHALLVLLIPIAYVFGQRVANAAVKDMDAKLRAAGHPQAADALDFLAEQLSLVASDAEKQAMAKAALAQGLTHPAVQDAVGGSS